MFLKIGIVGRALGLQGSFYVSGRDEPIPTTVKQIKIGRSIETARDARILKSLWQKGRASIVCDLAGDRTSAELLTGMSIWVDASNIVVEDDSEYLLVDLRGREVIDVNGETIGIVQDVVRMPASTNLIVLSEARDADVEIPVIADYVEMGFKRGESRIKLTVAAETFDEIWNSRGKKPK